MSTYTNDYSTTANSTTANSNNNASPPVATAFASRPGDNTEADSAFAYPIVLAEAEKAHSSRPLKSSSDGSSLLIPTASAHVLPATGQSQSTANLIPSAVSTSAVATVYDPNANKPIISSSTTRRNGQEITTTVTHYPAGTVPARRNNNNNTTATASASHGNNNDNVPQDVQLRLRRMKRNRKIRQATATTAGVVVGGVILGPIGAAIFGIASHVIVKGSGRAAESRIRQQHQLPSGSTATASRPTAIATPVRQGQM